MTDWYPHRQGVNEHMERVYLAAGTEPEWVRVHRDGIDITDQPDLWTDEDRARREAWLERRARYES
ncbi:hypothetical protein [Microbacterium luteum]|uniref:hypothetical protein n=1 Tax=Microbacterium luteum TaxID=2782167 RepID=UPI001888CD9A|nr:hypothetical protein [Microbacterium luteum]